MYKGPSYSSHIELVLMAIILLCYIVPLYFIIKYKLAHFDDGATPKNIRFSYILSKAIPILEYGLPVVPFILGYHLICSIFAYSNYQILFGVLAGVALGRNLASLLLLAVKAKLTNRYSITVLRSFKKALSLRAEILPTLGTYGHLKLISDSTLQRTHLPGDEEFATNIFSQHLDIKPFFHDDWKSVITGYLKESNLIVFYLSEIPSENIYWEMDKVNELGLKNRTLIIVEESITQELEKEERFVNLEFLYILRYSFYDNFKRDFKYALDLILLHPNSIE